jgi:CheY-like chemotaxis protein
MRLPEGARVLLADDDPLARRRAAGRLFLRGYDVVVAGSFRDALFRLGGCLMGREPLDAVVWNLKRPARSGGEVIASLRRRDRTVPIVLFGEAAARFLAADPSAEPLPLAA